MSKKCVNCGVELEDEALFCEECGTQQPTNEEKKKAPKTKLHTLKLFILSSTPKFRLFLIKTSTLKDTRETKKNAIEGKI